MPRTPVRLLTQQLLCDHLEGVTTANGYDLGYDLAGCVWRGRGLFGAKERPLVSVLQRPVLPTGSPAGEDGVWRKELLQLVIQGVAPDDPKNPTDPAEYLLAAIEHRLAEIIAIKPGSGTPKYPDLYMLGDTISSMVMGQGVVRPPDGKVSDSAFFYVPLDVMIVSDKANPYAA